MEGPINMSIKLLRRRLPSYVGANVGCIRLSLLVGGRRDMWSIEKGALYKFSCIWYGSDKVHLACYTIATPLRLMLRPSKSRSVHASDY
eukprot:5985945-Pyramimonas_sp.AAC.1